MKKGTLKGSFLREANSRVVFYVCFVQLLILYPVWTTACQGVKTTGSVKVSLKDVVNYALGQRGESGGSESGGQVDQGDRSLDYELLIKGPVPLIHISCSRLVKIEHEPL